MSSPTPNTLPHPTLLTTSHTTTGTSTLLPSTTIQPFTPFGPSAVHFTTLFSTSSTPASNTVLPASSGPSIPRPSTNGSVFCTSDLPPNSTSAFHRTRTVDYMCVLKGEVWLRVDGGKEEVVKEGGFCVQRGGLHSWINKTDSWTRLLFVMLDAEPIVLEDGTVLEDAFFPHKPASAQ